MQKIYNCLFILSLLQITQVIGQTNDTTKVEEKPELTKIEKSNSEIINYRRSSLHTMIIEDSKLPKKDLIIKTFMEAPFPEKYNNHSVEDKSINLNEYLPEGIGSIEKKKDEEAAILPAIDNYFSHNKVANKIVAKWFSRDSLGAFSMQLIQERGLYDASAQAQSVAANTERGKAMLADAGEDLIPNTFVVVSFSKFVSNEITALAAKETALALADKIAIQALKEVAVEAAENAYEKARQGYSIWTTAYLYELNWNDSTSAVFYQDYWMDHNNIDSLKKIAFDTTSLFQLKLVGFQKASAFITGLGANAENEEMIIKNATLKSVDAVYAKLQRKFEKFRTKTPLISIDPLGAKIGLKEGLEKGDKYEVLEQVVDEKGKVTYKRKGIITVDKKNIWDNRFAAGETPLDEEGNPVELDDAIEFTHFKGGKGYYPGMLIRQIN